MAIMAMTSAKTARVIGLTALTWAACQFMVPWLIGSAMAAINTAFGGRMDPYIAGGFYNLFIAPALVGGIAGYFTVALLRRWPGLQAMQARTVMLVAMGALFLGIILLFIMSSLFMRIPQYSEPAPGEPEYGTVTLPSPDRNFVTGFFTGLLPGLMIGYSIASEIDRHGPKLTRQQLAWIAAGWGLGFAVGDGLQLMTRDLIYAPFFNSGSPGGRLMELLMLLPEAMDGLVAGAIGAWFTLRGIQAEVAAPHPV